MNNTSIINVFKNIGAKQLITIIISVILLGTAIGYMGFELYKSTRTGLQEHGKMDVMESSDKFSQYLLFDQNELKVAGYAINNMLLKKNSTAAILNYMEVQSKRMEGALDKGFTGLYGYINGEYLDGSGWVPDKDFVPTERPWYKAAMKKTNETVFVDPYVDKQTGKIMITIAEMLDDNESVIALDIGLSGVQKITDAIAKDTPGAMVMVLDSRDVVIAHSDNNEVGKAYSDSKNTLGNHIVSEINKNKDNTFETEVAGQSYMVFSKELLDDWHCASVIDTSTFYSPLLRIIITTIAIGLLAMLLLLSIFYRLSQREIMNRNMHVQIKAAADVYEYFLDIYLEDDAYYVINDMESENDGAEYIGGARERIIRRVESLVDENSKPFMREFLDLSTLTRRLADKKSISEELLSADKRWYRARFICADRLEDGTASRVLLGIELIDDEKREKERLRHLAETDLMTGISNRVTGEYGITSHLENGKGGMFVLFDIDHFKLFNDRFGHTVGDQVIISVVNCLKNSFRSEDVVMRLGGDELAAFAVGVHDKKAAEGIMARFYDNLSHVVISDTEGEKITVSAGVAFSPDGDTLSFEELYKNADHCMYESKKTYNNKVTYFE